MNSITWWMHDEIMSLLWTVSSLLLSIVASAQMSQCPMNFIADFAYFWLFFYDSAQKQMRWQDADLELVSFNVPTWIFRTFCCPVTDWMPDGLFFDDLPTQQTFCRRQTFYSYNTEQKRLRFIEFNWSVNFSLECEGKQCKTEKKDPRCRHEWNRTMTRI